MERQAEGMIVDMHCDTLSREKSLRRNRGHLDFLRMRENGYTLQNFAMFVDMALYENPWERTLELAQHFKEEMEKNTDLVQQVSSWEDICRAQAEGKLCAMLTMEEGGVCKGEIQRLEHLYHLGVRMMTLTWNYTNELGTPAAPGEQIYCGREEQKQWPNGNRAPLCDGANGGLTDRGMEFVCKMQELGMMVDVSHLSDQGFYQVAGLVQGPFVASHSNSRAIRNHPRNLTDDMIRVIGEHGGCVGLNFCDRFIGAGGEDLLQGLARHARQITNVGGMEVLGLGSDFDGIQTNPYLTGVQDLPKLWETLRQAKFHESELEMILGRNVLRVYQEVLGA